MDTELTPRVLRLRQSISQAATKKFDALGNGVRDGRIHDLLQIWGAQRTGRWAGRRVQLQNLKRPPPGVDTSLLAELALDGYDVFNLFYGEDQALEMLGGAVRAAIATGEDTRLVVSDLSNIESRVLGWLTQDPKLNAVFANDLDPYKAFAVEWLGKRYDEVDKETRNFCKPPSLGCGYGLGPRGLQTYAESMGVVMEKEDCKEAVKAFRSTYRAVPQFWKAIEADFIHVIQTGGQRGLCAREGRFLTMVLPNGRKLWYFDPHMKWTIREIEHEIPYDVILPDGTVEKRVETEVERKRVLAPHYWGTDQYHPQWSAISTYGAKLTENLVQAIARDVLVYGMRLYTSYGENIIGHVHDEVIAEEPRDKADERLELLNWCLSQTPPWAPGLVLAAEGYVARRYRKG